MTHQSPPTPPNRTGTRMDDITHLSSRGPTHGLPAKLDQLFLEKRPVQVSGIDSKGIHRMKNTHSRNLVKFDNSCKNLCFLPRTCPPAPPSSVGHGVQAGAQKQTSAFPVLPHLPAAQAKFCVGASKRWGSLLSSRPHCRTDTAGPRSPRLHLWGAGFEPTEVSQGDLRLLPTSPTHLPPRSSAPKVRVSLRDKYSTAPTHSTRAVAQGLPKRKSKP